MCWSCLVFREMCLYLLKKIMFSRTIRSKECKIIFQQRRLSKYLSVASIKTY